jgi:hypothetical protein
VESRKKHQARIKLVDEQINNSRLSDHVSRPFSVTMLAIGVLTLAGLNLIRAVAAFQQMEFLTDLLPVSPIYLIVSGLVWGVVGLVLAFWLWSGHPAAAGGTLAAALAYSLYYWIDRSLLAGNPPAANWLFALLVNLSLLVVVCLILFRRKARTFFGAMHDR